MYQVAIERLKQGDERMTIKFYNTKSEFGDDGPFEAFSKEALADEMMPTLKSWAREAAKNSMDTQNDVGGNYMEDDFYMDHLRDMRAEFIDGLEAQYHGEPRLIFDNGGGITLQLPGYAHTYEDAEQCAEDIREWGDTHDTSGWDGNDEDAVFEPTTEQQANGGYDVRYLDAFLLGQIDISHENWENVRCLQSALGLVMPDTLDGLLEAMRNDHPCVFDDDSWRADLPTFGGEEPRYTEGVWSWDEKRLLVGTCSEDLEIVNR
jgi:hypothetical protein